MRCQRLDPKSDGLSLKEVAATLANSSIIFALGTNPENKDTLLLLMVSNCMDGDDLTTVRLQAALGKEWLLKDVQNLISHCSGKRKFIDSDGPLIEGRPMNLHYQQTSGFLNHSTAHEWLQGVAIALEGGEICSHHNETEIGELTRYPMKQLFKRKGASVLRTVDKHVRTEAQVEKWFAHLRAAGISEFELAHIGPELMYKASKYYKPERQITLQTALKKAIHDLAKKGEAAKVIAAYKDKQWDLAAVDGIDEKISTKSGKESAVSLVGISMSHFLSVTKRGMINLPWQVKASGKREPQERRRDGSLRLLKSTALPIHSIYASIAARIGPPHADEPPSTSKKRDEKASPSTSTKPGDKASAATSTERSDQPSPSSSRRRDDPPPAYRDDRPPPYRGKERDESPPPYSGSSRRK